MPAAELQGEALALKEDGNALFAKKAYDEAIGCYTRALALSPGHPLLLSNASACHLGLKQWAQALAAAEECLAADPGFAKAYGRKAAAQIGLIRPGDAERTLLAGLKVDPGSAYLQEELAALRRDDDGDQSPVRSKDGSDRQLRALLERTGMELHPLADWPADSFRPAMLGAEDEFVKEFEQADLKLRALAARLPLTIVTVLGAQRVGGPGGNAPALKHDKVLKRLLEAGARPDCRDAIGYTALHHCIMHAPALDLAQMLIDAGADVNAQDRFGTHALLMAVMTNQADAVRFLLDRGANPELPDNDGCTALQLLLAPSHVSPAIRDMLINHQYKDKMKSKDKEAPKVCAQCGAEGATKKCGGCSTAFYCNRECQVAHWGQHKGVCRPAAASGGARAGTGTGAGASGRLPATLKIPVIQSKMFQSTINQTTIHKLMTGTGREEMRKARDEIQSPQQRSAELAEAVQRATPERADKVKIQVPQTDMPAEAARNFGSVCPLLCYNQDRSLNIHLDGGSPAGRQLVTLIRREGILNAKGYFPAYFDETCALKDGVPTEICVYTGMLPLQNW
ncbi:hypothetical protein HYH03_010218 [Edaphochlamys debaryana]|uniref:MYND-type domain-containing protein n=1 Tax=Edaphochlamys debaryana TaxID=47281 RepID=A0A835XUJ7_9CHLO|nr:hypothetical protein HYH03_010218 [Edaphochlamys debaryana]|eukprot:KAG2491432.1 hypothetical protein HYH03_010218 [Edaphochlamys debaryana]